MGNQQLHNKTSYNLKKENNYNIELNLNSRRYDTLLMEIDIVLKDRWISIKYSG